MIEVPAGDLGACPRNLLLREGVSLAASRMLGRILSRGLRSPLDPWGLVRRSRATSPRRRGFGDRKVPREKHVLRSRSRFGSTALATDITRTGSWRAKLREDRVPDHAFGSVEEAPQKRRTASIRLSQSIGLRRNPSGRSE